MLAGKALLTPIQRQALILFSSLPDQERFYLTGGTALAEFYLGHRLSFDLDFFTGEAGLVLPFSYQFEAAGPAHGLQVSVTRRFATMVEFLLSANSDTLRIDLALDSPFRFEPAVLSQYGVWVNDFVDLRVDKLLAYYGRAEPRDAIDLFMILQHESRANLLDLAASKDPGFDLYWFAVALNRAISFPDELARWPVKMLVEVDPPELKHTFQQWAVEIMATLA